MQCTNCGRFIAPYDPYYRAGMNKTVFCSYACVQDMYQDLFTKEALEKTIELQNTQR